MHSTRYSSQILIKLHLYRRIFRKIFIFQVLWNSLQWKISYSRSTDGLTDRQTEKNSEETKTDIQPSDVTELIVAFSNFAKVPKNNLGLAYHLCKKNKHTLKLVQLVILHKHMFLSFNVEF